MNVAGICEAIRARYIRIPDHADEEAAADRLTLDEIYFSTLSGELIEDYATDKPYPGCLIYGRTAIGEPAHSVWAYDGQTRWAVLVTVHRPDPNRWIDWRERRTSP